MKELLLIRHAKSSWQGDGADHERPLARRGERAAPAMGQRLAAAGAAPDWIVTSDATRALATARLIADGAGLAPGAVVVEPRLYDAGVEDIVDLARGLDDAFDRVAMLGHNPAIAWAVTRLCGLQPRKLPTAAVVRIGFPIARWRDLDAAGGTCIDFDYPKRSA